MATSDAGNAGPANVAVHAIILTLNEEKHLARCIASLAGQCASITVVDSGSQDGTVDIARASGAEVLVNPWVNYATQLNFAIDKLSGREGWLLRIDADEVFDQDSLSSLGEAIAAATPDIDGLLVRRRIYFMGQRIRHGGIEPIWHLRLWRNGRGRCEQRWMDEHVHVGGKVRKSGLILSDMNLNTLSWWISKHNGYASREAVDLLRRERGIFNDELTELHWQAGAKRWVKEVIYARLPAGTRALGYFLYRYLLRMGFLDGVRGTRFHLLQGFWYRYLVDAKVAEVKEAMAERGLSVEAAVKQVLGIDAQLS